MEGSVPKFSSFAFPLFSTQCEIIRALFLFFISDIAPMQFCGELVQMYMAAFAPQCTLVVVVAAVVKNAHFNVH